MRLRIAALLLALLSTPGSLRAAPPCGPGRAGERVCMAGSVCECRHERGGTLIVQPPGWRWSCSTLSSCGEDAPAAPEPPRWPEGLGLELQLSPGAVPPSRPGRPAFR